MKIKNLFLATLTVMAGLTLTACGSENKQEPSTTQTDETITLNFGAMGSIDAVPLVIAQENGYFKEEGLNVNLEMFTAAKLLANVSSSPCSSMYSTSIPYSCITLGGIKK